MDRNQGGSSPDTVIARSSSEEEKRRSSADYVTSGNYVTVGDSSSSLDTLTSGSGGVGILSSSVDDRRKGKFDAFRSSFREGGIFKIKRKSRGIDASVEDVEQDDKG